VVLKRCTDCDMSNRKLLTRGSRSRFCSTTNVSFMYDTFYDEASNHGAMPATHLSTGQRRPL